MSVCFANTVKPVHNRTGHFGLWLSSLQRLKCTVIIVKQTCEPHNYREVMSIIRSVLYLRFKRSIVSVG